MVTTGAGDPSRFIPAWKEAGIKVFPVVPAVALAKLVAKRGADGVIADVNSHSMMTRKACNHDSSPPLNTRIRMM